MGASAQDTLHSAFDILHYDAQVEPDIANKSIAGKVLIQLVSTVTQLKAIDLDCGELTIDSVTENGAPQKFARNGERLHILLSRPATAKEKREIEIGYHGTPRRGIRFFPDREQVYTVFSTSQWLVCVDAPDDKATLRLRVILPANLNMVGNGRLVQRHTFTGAKVAYEWLQGIPVPTYIFGFVAGPYIMVTEKSGRVELRYLSKQFSADQLQRIFRDTADMIRFYEERSGVLYADATY